MAEKKKITIETVGVEGAPVKEIVTEGYLLIYMEGSKANMTGELDPQIFAPVIFSALAKKFGVGG